MKLRVSEMKNKYTGKFAYSTNEENYYGSEDSYEASLEEAIGCEDDLQQVWVGECVEHIPTIRVDSIIDQLRDDAWEKAGDTAESFLTVTPKQTKELQDLLNEALYAWMEKNKLEPNFFGIRGAKEYIKDESGKFVEVKK